MLSGEKLHEGIFCPVVIRPRVVGHNVLVHGSSRPTTIVFTLDSLQKMAISLRKQCDPAATKRTRVLELPVHVANQCQSDTNGKKKYADQDKYNSLLLNIPCSSPSLSRDSPTRHTALVHAPAPYRCPPYQTGRADLRTLPSHRRKSEHISPKTESVDVHRIESFYGRNKTNHVEDKRADFILAFDSYGLTDVGYV